MLLALLLLFLRVSKAVSKFVAVFIDFILVGGITAYSLHGKVSVKIASGNAVYFWDIVFGLGVCLLYQNEIYKMTRMLSEQQAGLKKGKEKLIDAISDISLQLKTPLTSMTVMANLLNEPNLEVEKRQEFTYHIRKLRVSLKEKVFFHFFNPSQTLKTHLI